MQEFHRILFIQRDGVVPGADNPLILIPKPDREEIRVSQNS